MKPNEERARHAFDEQRAAEELQRLQREIQQARSQRERAEAEFDEFLRGFHTPHPKRRPHAPVTPAPPPLTTTEHARASPSRSAVEPQLTPVPAAAPIPADLPADGEPVVETKSASTKARAVSGPRRNVRAGLLVMLAVVAIVAGVLALRTRSALAPAQAPPPAVATAPQNPPPEARDTPTTPAAPAPGSPPTQAQSAQPRPGVNLEMVTLRPVWVRVTVDGQRTIERELPAGQRIPLHADRTIVIRAGDAGAVAVSRDGGTETPLGREGVVATREFTTTANRDRSAVR